MKKKYKGEFGYISYRQKITLLRTLICLLVAVGFFVSGLIIYGSQKNILSIVAALGCLPTGWSAVNMVMFLRSKGCSESSHDRIEEVRGNLLIHYDHVITSYDKNFNVAASTVLDKNICLFTEDDAAVPDSLLKLFIKPDSDPVPFLLSREPIRHPGDAGIAAIYSHRILHQFAQAADLISFL